MKGGNKPRAVLTRTNPAIETPNDSNQREPKRLKVNGSGKSVRIAALPIPAVPDEPQVNQHHQHHPFSQRPQTAEALLAQYVDRYVRTTPRKPLALHHPFSQPTQLPDEPGPSAEEKYLGSPFKTPAVVKSRKDDSTLHQAPRNLMAGLGHRASASNESLKAERRGLKPFQSATGTNARIGELLPGGDAPLNLMETLRHRVPPLNGSRKLARGMLKSVPPTTADGMPNGFGYVGSELDERLSLSESPTRGRKASNRVMTDISKDLNFALRPGPSRNKAVSEGTEVLENDFADTKTSLSYGLDAASPGDPFIDSLTHGRYTHRGQPRNDLIVALDRKRRRRTFGGFTSSRMNSAAEGGHFHVSGVRRRSLPRSHGITYDAGQHPREISQFTSPASNAGSAFSLSGVSVTDQRLLYGEGLRSWIERMSENHGFQEDVTWRLWQAVGDLKEVDLTLKQMRDAAEKAAFQIMESRDSGPKKTLEGRLRDEDGTDSIRRDGSSRRSSSRHSPAPFTPVPTRRFHHPEYAPPEASRAGQFSRLAKQGRLGEALKRERRRISFGDVSSRQLEAVQRVTKSGSPAERKAETVAREEDNANDTGAEVVWGEKEDEILRNGNEVDLKAVEMRMGKHSVMHHTARLLRSSGLISEKGSSRST